MTPKFQRRKRRGRYAAATVAVFHQPDFKSKLTMLAILFAGILLAFSIARAQEARPLVDVQRYRIDAEIDLATQVLQAETEVTFVPREETNSVIFELNNGLNVTRVVGPDGLEIPAVRYRQDFTIRLSFGDNLPLNQPYAVKFTYDGRLQGAENSPLEGFSFASIDTDRAFLLYPARWFPVNGYGADQFSAKLNITAAPGLKVIASGLSTTEPSGGKVKHSFDFSQASFPGSIAVVPEEPLTAENEGVTTKVYFHTASEELAREYGEMTGAMMEFFSGKFGAPYSSSLSLVEVSEQAPTSFAAPGIVFISPYGMGDEVNKRMLGTEVAHQWWRVVVSPGNRNHIWLDLGLARYSSLLYVEEADGAAEFDSAIQEVRIDALTYDEVPIIQSGRLPAFSRELEALAGGKGTMVLNMLRWVIGDEAFFQTLHEFAAKFAWKSVTTDDFREVAEAASGRNLQPFFIQWIESNGTPEFSQEYTIYRQGGGKGFQVLGKIKQDMDTFQMPIELKIETEGEPEFKTVDVIGTSSDYAVDTFGKPSKVVLDPNNRILRLDESIRTMVTIRKGEQLVQLGYYTEALGEYQKALDINRYSSLAHYRIGEVFFRQNNYQSAANSFREALNGDLKPEWTEVWAHINLGNIFDVTGQRERAVNEYQLAVRTRDNTAGAQDEARKFLDAPYVRPRRTERIY